LLNTPIDEWVFNLGQYNNQLLQWLPRAQYWVNNKRYSTEKYHYAFLLYLADHITYKNLNHQIYLGKLLQREKTQKKI
jgi:hypothetical protein